MNEAHLHLLINHFPIIGLIIGTFTLLAGILLSSSAIRKVAFCIILFSSILAIPSNKTGDGAEEVVEHLSGITRETHRLIHEHEEKAETFMLFAFGLIILSALSLFMEWKKRKVQKYISILTFIVSMMACYMASQVGTSGGEISHPEIRKNFKGSENGESE